MSVDILDALATYLAAQSGVANVVAARIYPAGRVPQSPTFPYARLQLVSDVEALSARGYKTARVQLTLNADGSTGLGDAAALAVAVRDVAQGYQGLMGTIRVQRCLLEDGRDDNEDPVQGETRGPAGRVGDLVLTYEASVPSVGPAP